jgi:hypothetical protein
MKIIGIIIIVFGLAGIGLSGICLMVGYPNDFIKLLLLSLLVIVGGTGLVTFGVHRQQARDRQEWDAMYRSEPTPAERMHGRYIQPNQPFDDRQPEDDIQLDLGP